MRVKAVHVLGVAVLMLLSGMMLEEGIAQRERKITFGAAMRSFGVYKQQDDWAKAVEMLEMALEEKPNDKDATYWMGYYKGMTGDFTAMNEYWEKSLADDDDHQDEIRQNRETYFRNNFNNAIGLFNNAANVSASDEAQKEQRRNMFMAAIDGLKTAMVIKPSEAKPIEALSKAYMAIGELDQAKQLFRESLERNPDDLTAMQALGNMLMTEGLREKDGAKLEDAATHLEKVLTNRPDDLNVMQDLAAVYAETGKTDQAMKYFDRLLEKNPKDPELRMWYGRTLHQLGQQDKAMAQFMAVEKLSPDNVTAVQQLGIFFLEAADWENACIYLERLVKLQPENAKFWTALGQVYARQKETHKAMWAIQNSDLLAAGEDGVSYEKYTEKNPIPEPEATPNE